MVSEDNNRSGSLIDPEPLSVMLTALGAVGSVASIYALFQNRHDRRDVDRQQRRGQENLIRDALMGAETTLNELRAQVRSLEIAFEAGTGPGRGGRAHHQLARFGQVSLLFTANGHQT
jgi:hypothetical protein